MDKLKPAKELRNNILLGIKQEERRRAKVYLFGYASIVLFSLVGVVLSIQYILEGFYQSGFYEYLSLLLSGDSAVYAYWKELSFSLIDSMPIIGIIAFLTAAGALVWSGANAFTNTRRFIWI
ncbi:MAG: hypothetical protein UT09_C0017G0015 [Parcubacteria group bacterium GW2011_GWF2_38_8]|nr:MAG: hypothetical protein UT09_C0017G0015 [Parcubacteria group bacterium GW2011_GWF2_38_8]